MLTPLNMSPSRLPDFKQSYFPYQELDRIHGQPTLHQIVKIYKQMKENAASVPTTLAGGQHGYFPLVLSDQQWMAIPNAVPFNRPVNPGPFLPRPGRATNADIAQEKARWEQRVADYNFCQHLEATLRNQLAAAFNFEILDALRDRTSNTLQSTIPEIITYLFEEYGELSPDELLEKEDEVKAYVYDPSQPVSVIFNEIMTLRDMYELTGATLSEAQMMRIAYTILNRARIFKDYLLTWNNGNVAKTWNNFQAHFRRAYRDLKKVNALQIQHSSINHAEMLHELKTHQNNSILQLTETLKNAMLHNVDPQPIVASSSLETANAATTSTLRQEIQELRKMVQQLSQNVKQPTKKQKQPRQYCWTHGWCAHNGNQCQAPAVGHQVQATLANKMGGSDKNCPPT